MLTFIEIVKLNRSEKIKVLFQLLFVLHSLDIFLLTFISAIMVIYLKYYIVLSVRNFRKDHLKVRPNSFFNNLRKANSL